MYNAIDICISQDQNNPDLPLYMIKIGNIYISKYFYDCAKSWCTEANNLALKLNNEYANQKANICLEQVKEILSNRSSTEYWTRRLLKKVFKND